jgi:Winged helix domain, variant/ATPase family associated with various cellular activities (AAA)
VTGPLPPESPAPPDADSVDASLLHLLGRLQLVEARVRRTVAWRRADDPNPDDGFRGLYISADQAERMLAGGRAPAPPDAEAAALLARVEADADAAEQRGAGLRLRRLSASFGLDQLDVELLLVALAPDLDPRFERLYGYLHDDVSRRRPSIGLALELCGVPAVVALARRRLSPGGALVDRRLLAVEDQDRPFLTRSLRVADRVTAHLLGDDTPDPAVAAVASRRVGSAAQHAQGLARALAAGVRLAYLHEHPGADAAALGAAVFAEAGRPVLTVDLERLRAEDDPEEVASLVGREAALLGAGVVAGPVEALVARGLPAVRAFSELTGSVVLAGARPWDPAWSSRVPLLGDVAPLDHHRRAELWRTSLDGHVDGGLDPLSVTGRFRLTPWQVERAATAARLQAQAAGRAVGAEDLRAGARAQNAAGLERLARRIEPAVGLADLVLPPDVLDQLGELLVRARQRERVLDDWRLGGAASRRRGLCALFAGPSGTGKTMAAEVLAGELGFDLYAIDLATVVDKYIGETEKNLDRIFAESERVNGVLLFDEADALFGKRSEVSDAHDRYANVEVAYLLQRMELFDGIAILATNLRSNLDEAFTRRLDVVVEFPEPEEEHRRSLWDRCLGPYAPRADDLDLDFLARAFRLSGGNIRNIVVAAAHAAADEDRAVSMADLIRATHREYRKLGRLTVPAEFGTYFEVLAPPG